MANPAAKAADKPSTQQMFRTSIEPWAVQVPGSLCASVRSDVDLVALLLHGWFDLIFKWKAVRLRTVVIM